MRVSGRAVGRVAAPADVLALGRTDAERVALRAPLVGPVLALTGLARRSIDAAVVGRALAAFGIRVCCAGLAAAERDWAVRVAE